MRHARKVGLALAEQLRSRVQGLPIVLMGPLAVLAAVDQTAGYASLNMQPAQRVEEYSLDAR